jgi:hypothetical protein
MSADEGLSFVGGLNRRLDELCAELGREPRSIRRSFTALHAFVADTPFVSEASFREFVERYREIGIDELVLYYPPDRFYPEGAVQPGLFERLARDVIPELRD